MSNDAAIKSKVLPDYKHPLCQSVSEKTLSIEDFWQAVSLETTPLIEVDPDNQDCQLVSFVCRLNESPHHMCVNLNFGEPRETRMNLIPDTDVLYLSYRFEKDTRLTYSFAPDMPLINTETADNEARKALMTYWEQYIPVPDPLNPNQFTSPTNSGTESMVSVLALEDSLSDEYSQKREQIQRGWLHREEFVSEILGNTRQVWVYSPPGYKDSEQEYPLLLLLDGAAHIGVSRTHRILDNLIADGKIPPLMAVFIDNAADPARSIELPCSDNFVEFVQAELIPWLYHHFPLSPLPTDWTVTGASYGGLASVWLAYKLSHQIGNVISQSGSFWWGPGYPVDMSVSVSKSKFDRRFLIKELANSPRLPIRFWVEVGKLESESAMVQSNRAMRDVLIEKGYDLEYAEFGGPHSFFHWQSSLPLALVHIMSG